MKFVYNAAPSGSGDFESLQPGSYAATPVAVISMGTQKESPFPDSTPRPQLLITWEIDERQSNGKRFTADQWVTASLHPMAKLTQMLESWRGKPLADGEEFNTAAILGKTALVNIVLNQKGYPKVDNVAALPKQMQKIAPESELINFDLYDPDWDAYAKLREGLQNRIEDSVEWGQLFGAGAQKSAAPAQPAPKLAPDDPLMAAVTQQSNREAMLAEAAATPDFDDDLPF